MTGDNSNAGLPLRQTKLIIQQLDQFEDRLNHLLASYQFYDNAIRALVDPDKLEDTDEWYVGLFLNQQWLKQQGETLITELTHIKQTLPA